MKAMIKTLIGDQYNIAAVAVIVALAWLLKVVAEPMAAAFLVPFVVMGAAIWLGRH